MSAVASFLDNAFNNVFGGKNCIQQQTSGPFQVHGLTRTVDDACAMTAQTKQSRAVGQYYVTNLNPCDPTNVYNTVIDNPAVLVKDGYGIHPTIIDTDSTLRNHPVWSHRECELRPQPRPFLSVPFMGRGRGDAELEARMQQSQVVRVSKDCGTVTEQQFDVFTPLIPKLQQSIQDPKNLVQETAAQGWIRGGLPSRAYMRDLNC
jgi:hypothetical protein